MYEVKNGSRTLQFTGKLIAESSSWRRGSSRWIEFSLYKTESGSYVLSRIGVSLLYHGASCPVVKIYYLKEVDTSELSPSALACSECQPSLNLPVVFPETYRYWAQVSKEPTAVLEALYKYDEYSGAKYLTYVAERLLEQASDNDTRMEYVYRIETIP